MNTKKTIALVTLSTIIAGLAISATNADFGDKGFNFDNTEKSQDFKKGHKGGMKGLTDEEKTSLESMSTEEKQAFFDAKKEERKAEMEAREAKMEEVRAIMEKKKAGEELTEDEQAIIDEMKSKFKVKKGKRGGHGKGGFKMFKMDR